MRVCVLLLVAGAVAAGGCGTSRLTVFGPPPGDAVAAAPGEGAAGCGGCAFTEAPAEEADIATRDVLLEALADERRSAAMYQAVLDRHGRVMPFANIVRSERMHARHVEQMLVARGFEAPADGTEIGPEEAPATLAECYALGVQSELDNIAMYDRLMAETDDEGVREGFARLRAMSEERHLVAFRRFSGR